MTTFSKPAAAAWLLVLSFAARAGVLDCEELKQPGILEQRDRCVAHAACNFVLTRKPDCAQASHYLERMKGNVLEQLTNLFTRESKAITANDVYEANVPDIAFSQEWRERFSQVGAKIAAAGTALQSGKSSDGDAWVYQGDVREGRREGWGIFFWSSGMMYRGQFAQDWRTGLGESASSNGYRAIGAYVRNQLNGEAWVRLPSGAQIKGSFADGKLEGAGSYLFPNGNSYSGNFVGGDFNGHGIYRWADGSSFEGNFSNDKMDGAGTFTSPSGEQSARTYAADKLVAGAAAAPVAVSAVEACDGALKSCSTVCLAGGLLGALVSGGKSDTSAAQTCVDQCGRTHGQCLAGAAPAGNPAPERTKPIGTGRAPDARCAFAKLHLGFYAPNSTYIDNALFQLRILPLRFSYGAKDRLQEQYAAAAKRAATLGGGSSAEQRAVRELAARSIREWKDTLSCIEETNEFILAKGEDIPTMMAYPIEWMGRPDGHLPQSLHLTQSVPRGVPDWNDYPWKRCELVELGIAREGLRQVVLHRKYDSTGLHSQFMLRSQLAYLRDIYQELTGESALSTTLRAINPDPRTTPAGRRALAELRDTIAGLDCEAGLGFPFSAETTFVKSHGRSPKRYPGKQIPRCTTARACDAIRSE